MASLLDSQYQRRLLKKWAPILESGSRIDSDHTKTALAQVLENTRNYYVAKGMLCEAGAGNGSKQADIMGPSRFTGNGTKGMFSGNFATPGVDANADYYLPNVVMPILRRVFPNLIANELVGVQPLTGPIGFAMAYRPTYNKNGMLDGNPALHEDMNTEIGYNPVDTRYTGVSAEMPFSLSSPESEQALNWKAYAGNDGGRWNGVGAPLGDNSEYANLNEGTYPTVTFGLIKSGVEAKTRKLGANWSPEMAEDSMAMHGIDVEKEMVNILTQEIGGEIDRQIITEMVKTAITTGSTSEWTPISADGLDQMGRLATLLTQITIEANQIAVRTRRGNANFVVTSPKVCALLQQLSMNKITTFKNGAEMPTVPESGVGVLTKIGLVNDDQQLLVRDSYAAGEYVLMGYKGVHPGDSGIIYCPYIPIQLAKVLQPGTFTPSIGARTRYGIMNSPWDARNYYHFMKITGLSNPYAWNGSRRFVTASPIQPPTTAFGSPTF